MIDIIFELIRYILTFLFGITVSASLSGIDFKRKSITVIICFSVISLLFQGILYITLNVAVITMIYPLIIHLPLFLMFVIIFDRKITAVTLSITTAYLCCQIANWFSILSKAFGCQHWVVDLTYSVILIITFVLVIKYIQVPYSKLLKESTLMILSFSIIPIFYYIFDYASTVYTELLYKGQIVAIEFMPFLMSICYLIFSAAYFKQYEEKISADNLNAMLNLKQMQSYKEISLIKQNAKNMALIRHDMRHFLTTILNYIDKGDTDLVKKYIYNIIEDVNNTAIKKYCSNETVNIILSSYENAIIKNDIDFQFTIEIPNKLSVKDVDLTSILSNAMENAINAASSQKTGERVISLSMLQRNGKLLISVQNSYDIAPKFKDDMPIAEADDHGFGTQSIYYTAEKLHGNCRFSISGGKFILQVVI